MVDFNVPPCVGNEIEYVKQAIESHTKSITYDKWNNCIRYGDVIV